jgi:hypothetical protein
MAGMVQYAKIFFNRWLVSSKLPVALALIAFILTSPFISTGLYFDDYYHQRQFRHPECFPQPILSLFTLAVSKPFKGDVNMQLGVTPWWTFEELKISFFRPLTAATHWLDYQLWPESPAAMHVHSLLWFAGMIFVATAVYRQIGPSAWIGGIAALFFAIDDAHAVPAGWIANRNALAATLFGLCCFYLHVRRRRENWKIGAIPAWCCFIAGLLCGESCLAIGAYLISYELFLSSDPWHRRICAISPYAVIVLFYLAAYFAGGFGAHGSEAYVDPVHNPLAFLNLLLERIPLLLYGQWFFSNNIIYGFLSKSMTPAVLIFIYMILAVILYLLIPLLKRNAVTRFWAFGMVLSLLPFSTAYPNNRLLIIPGFGAMGLLAQFFAVWREKSYTLSNAGIRRHIARAFFIVLIIVHGVLAPIVIPGKALGMGLIAQYMIKEYMALSDDIRLEGKTVVFINPPVPLLVSYLHFIREGNGLDTPKHYRVLATGLTSDLKIQRMDARTLEVERAEGFINQDMDKLFRGSATPMQVGQQVDMGDMCVEVLSLTPDRRPLRVRFTFVKPLEDPSMVFYFWQGRRCELFKFPAPGKSVSPAPV